MCLLTCLAMTAAQFTQEQAKQAAEQFLKQKVSKVATIKATKLVPIKQKSSSTNNECKTMAYAVNLGKNDGFVLVVGNEHSNDIIGYCDHGSIDAQNMPSNMRSWLESYMTCAGEDVKTASMLRTAQPGIPTKTPIHPLLTSKWGQSEPYNGQTPIIDDMHCYTGCTITAMAQVMYYHKWPKAATQAIPAYTPNNSAGTSYPSLPALEPTTFDWDRIYPSYDYGEDGTEVARLLKYIGTASCADYGTSATSATGYKALAAAIKYFDYDASAHAVWRRERSYNEWVDMLYAELKENRPVMFSGTSVDGAHSYVVDGYDEEDFFHVNWGWNGTSDGYYKVILMDPKEQGIGGSTNNEAYIADQVGFFGVKPNSGGASHIPSLTVLKNYLYADVNGTGDYTTQGMVSESPYYNGQGYLVTPAFDSYNFNIDAAEFELGSRLIKDDGSVVVDFIWDQSANFAPNMGFIDHSRPIYLNPIADTYLTDGNYKMYFTSKLKTSDTWQINKESENHYTIINLDHASGKLTATAVSLEPELVIKEVKFNPETPVVNKPCVMTLKVENTGTGTFHGDLGMFNQDLSGALSYMTCDIEPRETIDLNMRIVPKKTGTINYEIKKNRVIPIYTGTMTVAENVETSNCDLTITHQVTNAEGTEIAAPKAKIDLTITNNSDNNYFGAIYIYCFKYTGDEGNMVSTSYIETIPAHQTVVLHRESPELTGGDSYRFSTMYIKNGQEIEQDIPETYYTTVPYYISYDAYAKETTKRWSATLQPDATECAIDLTVVSEATTVNTSANPNLIIFVSDDSPLTGDNIVKKDQAENVKLSDQYPYYIPFPFKANHISYTRTPERYYDVEGNKGWTTLVLPFAATSCHATINGVAQPLNWYTGRTNGDILLAAYQYENGNEMIFGFPETTLKSFMPYILGVPSTLNRGSSLVNVPITFSADNVELNIDNPAITGRNYKMRGTFAPMKDEEEIYVLNADGSAFVNGTHSVNPFNAYVDYISSQTPADMLTISLYFDVPTSISEIIDEQQNDLQGPYYNLNGQRVSRPSKGIYIVNGKKVIIK